MGKGTSNNGSLHNPFCRRPARWFKLMQANGKTSLVPGFNRCIPWLCRLVHGYTRISCKTGHAIFLKWIATP